MLFTVTSLGDLPLVFWHLSFWIDSGGQSTVDLLLTSCFDLPIDNISNKRPFQSISLSLSSLLLVLFIYAQSREQPPHWLQGILDILPLQGIALFSIPCLRIFGSDPNISRPFISLATSVPSSQGSVISIRVMLLLSNHHTKEERGQRGPNRCCIHPCENTQQTKTKRNNYGHGSKRFDGRHALCNKIARVWWMCTTQLVHKSALGLLDCVIDDFWEIETSSGGK